MGVTTPATKVIPSLGLVEASFPRTSWPGWSEQASRGPCSWPSMCPREDGLIFSSTLESLASKGATQMVITASRIFFIKVLPQGLKA